MKAVVNSLRKWHVVHECVLVFFSRGWCIIILGTMQKLTRGRFWNCAVLLPLKGSSSLKFFYYSFFSLKLQNNQVFFLGSIQRQVFRIPPFAPNCHIPIWNRLYTHFICSCKAVKLHETRRQSKLKRKFSKEEQMPVQFTVTSNSGNPQIISLNFRYCRVVAEGQSESLRTLLLSSHVYIAP